MSRDAEAAAGMAGAYALDNKADFYNFAGSNNTDKSQRKMSELRHRPMVSVVMIAYNNERYVADAICGVVGQRGDFDLQLIICDDCSTDATPQIIAGWKERFPDEIEFHRNPRNLGVQCNYLEAFGYVRGDYMAMCDADDYWTDPRKIARQLEYMEKHPECAVTFHKVVNYYEGSGVKSFSNGGQRPETTLADISRSNFITNMSVLYRRRLVDLDNLPVWLKEVRLVDYPMHMLYAAHGTIHYFNRAMGVYRQTESAIWSMTKMTRRREMSLVVRLHLIEYFAGNAVAVEGLRASSRAILISMVADDPDDAELKERLPRYASAIDPELTAEMVLEDAGRMASGRKKQPVFRRIMRGARIALSRLVPVPKPARPH